MPEATPPLPDTWYAHSVGEVPFWPALSTDVAVDTCIVGGGYAGLVTALELAKRGKQVALLEAKRIAWGASGRNGGFVAPGFAEDIDRIETRCGSQKAKALYSYSQLGVDYVRHTARQSERPVICAGGVLDVWRFDDAAVNPASTDVFNRRYSQQCEYWSRDRVCQVLDTSRYYHGVFDDDAFHIHPLHYAYALAEQLSAAGATIFESTPATRISRRSSAIVVTTPRGTVSADNVVLCTSAYDHRLFAPLARAILPVATHVVVTRPLDPDTNPIGTAAAVADTRRAGDYYRLLTDNRLMWGGKITTRQTPPPAIDAVMRRTIASVYPSLRNVEIEHGWSGLMGYCLHKMPIIGELSPGIWSATAFGGHGINTTAMAGLLIASAIAAGDARWRDFSAYRPQWAGGPLGKAGVQLSYWGMQIKDRIDERRHR